MSATTFDPLGTARDLQDAGFERTQAEALAKAMHQAATADLGALVTRADLKADLAALEMRFYRATWLQGGAIVAILAALRFLPS